MAFMDVLMALHWQLTSLLMLVMILLMLMMLKYLINGVVRQSGLNMVKSKDLRKAQQILLSFRNKAIKCNEIWSINKAIGYMCKIHIIYEESLRTVTYIDKPIKEKESLTKEFDNMPHKIEIEYAGKADIEAIKEIGIDINE